MTAALVVFSIIIFPAVFGFVYYFDDLRMQHIPFRWFYANCLENGDTFTWCPRIFHGYYLHGEGQVGMTHPVHVLLYRVFPFTTAVNIELLLSYPAIFGGTLLLLRRWRIPFGPASFGAFTFTFSGFNMLHFAHMNMVAVVAHLPWLLLAIDTIVRDRRSRPPAWLALALLTASQVLLGHPQGVYLCGLAEMAYAVGAIMISGKATIVNAPECAGPPCTAINAGLALLSAKCMGVAAGAIQLLPTLDMLQRSTRQALIHGDAEALAFAETGSLHPLNLLQFWSPYLFDDRQVGLTTHEFGIYSGSISTLAFIWILLRRNHLGAHRRLALAAAATAVITTILALGHYGFLHKLLLQLPLMSVFRMPVRHIVLCHFAFAVLNALFIADLCAIARTRDTRPRQILIVCLIPAVTALTILFWAGHTAAVDGQLSAVLFTDSWPLAAGGLLLFVILAISAGFVGAGSRRALTILLIVAAIDIASYGLTHIFNQVPVRLTDVLHYPVGGSTNDALYSWENELTLYGRKLTFGYAGLYPRRDADTATLARLRRLPRASLYTTIVLANPAVPLPDSLDIRHTAVVESRLKPIGKANRGAATVIRDRPGDIHVQCTIGSTQLLCVTERCESGWRVYVDGKPGHIVRVYGEFIGCVVEPGEHLVTFRFEPRSYRIGKVISAIAVVTTLSTYAYWRRKQIVHVITERD